MAVQFPVPSGPDIYSTTLEYFRGADLSSASVHVDPSRSPECPNMIRDEVGKVRKRTGWHSFHTFEGGAPINGVWILRGRAVGINYTGWVDGQMLVHVGDSLYAQDFEAPDDNGTGSATLFSSSTFVKPEIPPDLGDEPDVPAQPRPPIGAIGWVKIADGLNNARSWGVQFGSRFFLLDGYTIWMWDGCLLQDVSEVATVPTVIISASPSGQGGVQLNPFNLLSDRWKEQFKGNGDREYRLSTDHLEAVLSVEVLQSTGKWSVCSGSEYSVNLAEGLVQFLGTPPGAPPILGADNVRITVKKNRGGRDRLFGCRFGMLYGINGAQDRLFISGNPLYPNRDFFSEFNDPTYFADTSFSDVAQDEGEIVGYSTMSGYLVTHRKNGRDERNIVVRAGSLDSDGKAVFRTVNVIQGTGAVSPYAFASLDGEPLFLTKQGVYAITSREVTGERYGQQRSLYIASALQALTDLEDADATIWNDFYVLAAGGRLWLLDGMQKAYAKDAPNSAYQYECFYWTNIPARVLWTQGDRLCFGTADGRLCAFYTDPDDRTSYRDDPNENNPLGTPIDAYWDTPDMDGKGFWKNKTFRYIACRLASAASTGVTILAQVRGLWRQIYTDRGKARYFDWNYVDLEHFTFSADRTPHTLGGKIKLKKVDKVRFRFRNAQLNESFGLYGIGLEYTEPGSRYKG